jgi:hypothetical protein
MFFARGMCTFISDESIPIKNDRSSTRSRRGPPCKYGRG